MASKFDIFRFGPFHRQPIDKAIYCFLTLVVLVKGCDIKAAFLYLSRPIKMLSGKHKDGRGRSQTNNRRNK
ncbi:hypothetical protein D917_09377 [Trichinella nativa]|uniref:Uncharacterized protein n=1 Tax=Trichinella nativa TaxID=6335 RepID=A0A1Y3EG68_9BILA|nr:hypothetical protein D917_09377 [Trichinella nativa]